MADLRDRIAVITGASRGLGAGLARAFSDRGLAVAGCARSAPALAGGERALSSAVDVTDAAAVDEFCSEVVDRFGRIDLWVNNAGVLEPIGPLAELDPLALAQHIDVNINGVFNGSRAFIRHVRERDGGGVLINISSGAARSAYAGWSAYCAGKAAVDRLSECIALEEREHGLRVHSVAPGIIDTDMQALIRDCDRDRFPMVDKFLDLKARDAYSTPEFIAERLLELAFDPAGETQDVLVSLPRERS
jgi:benzil reductase ((S)-benzoin forming)